MQFRKKNKNKTEIINPTIKTQHSFEFKANKLNIICVWLLDMGGWLDGWMGPRLGKQM